MTLRSRLALWFVPITLVLALLPWVLTRSAGTVHGSSLPAISGTTSNASRPNAKPASEQAQNAAPPQNAPAQRRADQPPAASEAQAALAAEPARAAPANPATDATASAPSRASQLQDQLDQLRTRQEPVLLRYDRGRLELLENPTASASNAPWWMAGPLLAGAWLAGAWGLRRSLAPLYTLADEIARRGPSRLDALEAPPLPELRPAVAALNALLEGLRENLSRLELQEQSARRFAYNASHELRNPLTAARNYLEVLERHPNEPEAGAKALEAVRRTEKVLSSLLTLARLEGRGRVRGERVNLRTFLEANFELPVEGDATIWAERDLLELAIDNLVKNADEHAGSPARARIEIAPSGVWVWLEDDGPGFPADIRERAFEAFVKGGSGTGLGLAIVEAVARAHDGEAHLENRSDGGARVGLRFPSGSHQV